ncbi:MAG: hypothetical protein Q4G70_02830 [Pseudomonadota bacterium]|nr:hypothetical protein [Pseudomonadota bacterium]
MSLDVTTIIRIDNYLEIFDLINNEPPSALEIYQESHKQLTIGNNELAQKLYKLNYILYNSSIPPKTKIGKNTIFSYGAIGIILHEGAVIGDRCTIGPHVVIGGTSKGVPVIGDDCFFSVGCKVLGNINIGKCSIIGANALVIKDVPPYSVVAGSPAVVINTITPKNFHRYQGHYWCKNKPESIKGFIRYHWGVDY